MTRGLESAYAVGVDGCRAGWFAAWLDADGTIQGEVYKTVPELLGAHPFADPILIDVPIGLVSDGKDGRRCDQIARRLLGYGRASSVFSPPCREAVRAASYEAASNINERRTGKKLSKQAWGIVPKIRDVDDILVREPAQLSRVIEVHPEILFWALADRRPMAHRKSTREGVAERMDALTTLVPTVEEDCGRLLRRWPRSQVAADDILDAFAALATATQAKGGFQTIPDPPQLDDLGFPMRMVYCERPRSL